MPDQSINDMKTSLVIPCRDSRESLEQVVSAVLDLVPAPHEIIIIDDGSDLPLEILNDSDRIQWDRLESPQGPAVARNRGADLSSGDIILFLDADVIPPSDLIQRIEDDFSANPEISAVQTIYDLNIPHSNTSSRYQNNYYHFAFTDISSDYPAVCATYCFGIRRDVFLKLEGFDTRIGKPTVEDEAFGYRLINEGYKIFLDRSIQVIHLAQYSLLDLIRRKFRMSFYQVKSLLRGNKMPINRSSDTSMGNRTHHSRGTLAATLISPLIVPGWYCHVVCGILLTAAFIIGNFKFWKFLWKIEHPESALTQYFLNWVDQLVIFTGLTVGTIHFLMGKRY